jgi:ElaB/YqjD/DUF883 family membrane-anchored ribosome-binding protein
MGDTNAGDTGKQSGSEQQGLGQTATQVGQNIREMGTQVRDQATEKYNQLRDQATNYYQQGRDRATEWEQSLESYVQEKPIQAVLMAAGVGVLLGLLWKRS